MNENDVLQRVTTNRSGSFVFSLHYDRKKLGRELTRARILYATITNIPVIPDTASLIKKEFMEQSIYGTAALDGNPLPQKAINKILSAKRIEGYPERFQQQIRNLKKAYLIIEAAVPSPENPVPLQEEMIKTLHRTIIEDSEERDTTPGNYRNHLATVGDKEHGGVFYSPPKTPEDIKTVMAHCIDWLNSDLVAKEDPALRAALAHYHLTLIQPFSQGNGRTIRTVESLLLHNAGIKFAPYMLARYYYKNSDEYFWAFSLSQRSHSYNITPFLEFFLKALVSSLEKIQDTIFEHLRIFTLKHYYEELTKNKEITQRQLDLLVLLLEYKEGFSLRDLFEVDKFKVIYRNVTERTARNDLQRFLEKDLLAKKPPSQYEVNYRVIN